MKTFSKLTSLVMLVAFVFSAQAQDLPQPSQNASFTQRVGVTDITMSYSRPGVKERTIWGKLVPYNEIWRAGANASTKIEFSTDVIIDGKDVKAGKYAVFMIPSETKWTIIISSYVDGWGTTGYTEESDVVRITAEATPHAMTENLLFSVDQIKNESCVVNMAWEKLQVSFDVKINTAKFAAVNLEKAVKEADGSYSTYNKAAAYLLDNDGDKKQALELAIKSTTQQKKFWNLTVLAEAYAANGDMKMAIKTAKEAQALSEEAKYASYIERNKKNIETWGEK